MKKRLLSFILAICLIVPCVVSLTACTETEGDVVYTVTEAQWKINFNLTKGQAQPLSVDEESQQVQLFAENFSQALPEITSYTIFADGENYGQEGTCLFKVAPNALSIEFRLGGVLEDESGVFASSTNKYKGLTASIMSYFPFADHYGKFTFDQTKKAYVAENFVSTVVNEENINETYDIYTKSAEVTFRNGYLNTIAISLTEDNNYINVYSTFMFTFSNINNTVV